MANPEPRAAPVPPKTPIKMPKAMAVAVWPRNFSRLSPMVQELMKPANNSAGNKKLPKAIHNRAERQS
jgi:hypothetical protein